MYNFNGAQCGIAMDYDTIGLWYNKTLFDEAKISYPTDDWTWADLTNAAKAITALGNGKAVFNNRIEPIASVTGPSFLGWEHPPEPGIAAPPTTSDRPTPTRPAVTAGPS